jgi:predicted Rdx family selenoprotein
MIEHQKSKIDNTDNRIVVRCEHLFKGKICNSEIMQVFTSDDMAYNSPIVLTYCERCKGVVIFSFINNKLHFTFTDGNKYSNNQFFSPAMPPKWGGERQLG